MPRQTNALSSSQRDRLARRKARSLRKRKARETRIAKKMGAALPVRDDNYRRRG